VLKAMGMAVIRLLWVHPPDGVALAPLAPPASPTVPWPQQYPPRDHQCLPIAALPRRLASSHGAWGWCLCVCGR
jgi:hypothetical protein